MATAFLPSLFKPQLPQRNATSFICAACRFKSTFRRQRKALRVKPDPSFAPSKTETTDHIIFNPPSSVPNVYHTPLKFLPKSDPRRQLHSLAPLAAAKPPSTPSSIDAAADATSTPPRMPLPVRPQHDKKYHLTQTEIDEIRRLRAEDSRKWTRAKLAEKFECSQFFVSLCCCAPEQKERHDKELAEIKRRWGRMKTEAREERKARKTLWGRDV